MKTKFICSRCAATAKAALPKAVRSDIERAMYANHAGMLGVVDTRRGRVLFYCGPDCVRPKRRG